MLCQVIVTHKRFVVPETTDKHPDARPQKCAWLLAWMDFQIVQIIGMVEEIAKSSVMDRKNQMTVSNLSLLAQGTVVIHYFVDLIWIEELVVLNVAFPWKEIVQRAECLFFNHPRHHVAYQPTTYSELHNASAIRLICLDQTFSA